MQPGTGDYSAPSYFPHYPSNPYPADLLTPAGGGGGAYASAPPASPYGPSPDFSHHFDPSPPPQPPFNHPQFAPNSYAAGAPPTSGAAPAYSPYDPPPPPPNPGYNPASDQGAGFYGGSSYPHLPNPVPAPAQAPAPAPEPAYDPPIPSYYDVVGSGKFDQYGQYRDEGYGRYGHGGHRSGFDQSDALDEGVYRYDGGRPEPYGSRGTAGGGSKSSSAMFDDYGRAIGGLGGGKESSGGSAKIVRAVPKVDAQQDVKSGAQKFRVKILPEGWGQNTMDVLCQVFYPNPAWL